MSRKILTAVAASVVLLAGGTVVTGGAEAAAPGRARAATVTVSIDSHRVVTLPATLQPGLNKFAVSAAKPGSLAIGMRDADYTVEQVQADLKAAFTKNDLKALRRFEDKMTLVGGVSVAPGKTAKAWLDLPAGEYIALDSNGGNFGKITSFSVAGTPTGLVAPVPTAKLKAIKDVTWAKRPASIPHKGLLQFKNRASNNHFLFIVKLLRGKTVKDFAAFMQSEGPGGPAGPPPVDFTKSMEVNVVSPGHDAIVKYRMPRGNYVMVCFWPDASHHGMPHAAMGMFRGIKLT